MQDTGGVIATKVVEAQGEGGERQWLAVGAQGEGSEMHWEHKAKAKVVKGIGSTRQRRRRRQWLAEWEHKAKAKAVVGRVGAQGKGGALPAPKPKAVKGSGSTRQRQ